MIMLASPSGITIPQSQVAGLPDALDAKADLDSPDLTGTPTAPTASPGTNTTQLATTGFAAAAIAALVSTAPSTLNTLAKLATAINNDPDFAATINALLDLKAPIASPAFTGPAFFQMAPGGPGLTLSGVSSTTANIRVDASGNLIIDSGALPLWWNFDNRGPTRHFGTLGLFGANPIARPVVAGSRGGNVVIASILAAIGDAPGGVGLVNDQTTP